MLGPGRHDLSQAGVVAVSRVELQNCRGWDCADSLAPVVAGPCYSFLECRFLHQSGKLKLGLSQSLQAGEPTTRVPAWGSTDSSHCGWELGASRQNNH